MKEEKEEGKPEEVEEPQLEASRRPSWRQSRNLSSRRSRSPALSLPKGPNWRRSRRPSSRQSRTLRSSRTRSLAPSQPKSPPSWRSRSLGTRNRSCGGRTAETGDGRGTRSGWSLEDSIEDGLELDRMEVKPAEEMPQEPAEEEEAVIIEPPGYPSRRRRNGPGSLPCWPTIGSGWLPSCSGCPSCRLPCLFVSAPKEEQREEVKLGRRVHVVTASLGGEHYVRFNLWGPFRDAKGQAALRRGMPKIKHDLIFSGGRPEVARSIQENDLYFLERHILEIVSNATGIPVDQLDLKGLSVTRYSDETEVGEEG